MVTDRPHIEYAPPLPLYQRRKTRARAIGLIGVVLVFALAWLFGPAAWARTKLLHWQSRCMRYAPPARQVTYDDDQDLMARWWNGDPAFAGYSETTGTYHPGILRMAEPWSRFYDLYSPPGRAEAPTIFLHQRRASGGSRLVVVEFEGTDYATAAGPFTAGSAVAAGFVVSVFEPATLLRNPKPLSEHIVRLDLGTRQGKDHFRCYAGQADSADDAHFIIEFQLDGKAGVLDGWLLENDTVRLQVRTPTP